jgi:hypothetical protein
MQQMPIWIPVILAILGPLGTIATLIVTYWLQKRATAAAAVTVADKVQAVAVAASETAQATTASVAKLQETGDATHKIVNSRYDEIRTELKKSNENNERLTALLAKAGIIVPPGEASAIVAGGKRPPETAKQVEGEKK